jgi:hypothetical protein
MKESKFNIYTVYFLLGIFILFVIRYFFSIFYGVEETDSIHVIFRYYYEYFIYTVLLVYFICRHFSQKKLISTTHDNAENINELNNQISELNNYVNFTKNFAEEKDILLKNKKTYIANEKTLKHRIDTINKSTATKIEDSKNESELKYNKLLAKYDRGINLHNSTKEELNKKLNEVGELNKNLMIKQKRDKEQIRNLKIQRDKLKNNNLGDFNYENK